MSTQDFLLTLGRIDKAGLCAAAKLLAHVLATVRDEVCKRATKPLAQWTDDEIIEFCRKEAAPTARSAA